MTLEIYFNELKAFVEKYPHAKKFPVVTACDDEGNCYSPVIYGPSIGEYDENTELFDVTKNPENYNAICLN